MKNMVMGAVGVAAIGLGMGGDAAACAMPLFLELEREALLVAMENVDDEPAIAEATGTTGIAAALSGPSPAEPPVELLPDDVGPEPGEPTPQTGEIPTSQPPPAVPTS